MKFTRRANANWKGTGMEGKGTISTQSTTLDNAQLSFKTRFEQGVGTNPEELIAAAHAGCFSMKLAFNLQAAGFTAEELKTNCVIVLEDGTITQSNLQLTANVPEITEEKFAELVKDAEQNCPVSKLLKATVSVSYSLEA